MSGGMLCLCRSAMANSIVERRLQVTQTSSFELGALGASAPRAGRQPLPSLGERENGEDSHFSSAAATRA